MSLTKARYAASLMKQCERIVGAVHDDGPDVLQDTLDRARALPVPPGVDPDDALITIIAAMVDPQTPVSKRLHWTKAWTGGIAELFPRLGKRSAPKVVAEASPEVVTEPAPEAKLVRRIDPVLQCRPLVVERCIAGRIPASALTESEQDRAVRILHGRGWSDRAIADRMDVGRDMVRGRRIKLGLPVNGKKAAA